MGAAAAGREFAEIEGVRSWRVGPRLFEGLGAARRQSAGTTEPWRLVHARVFRRIGEHGEFARLPAKDIAPEGFRMAGEGVFRCGIDDEP